MRKGKVPSENLIEAIELLIKASSKLIEDGHNSEVAEIYRIALKLMRK